MFLVFFSRIGGLDSHMSLIQRQGPRVGRHPWVSAHRADDVATAWGWPDATKAVGPRTNVTM